MRKSGRLDGHLFIYCYNNISEMAIYEEIYIKKPKKNTHAEYLNRRRLIIHSIPFWL